MRGAASSGSKGRRRCSRPPDGPCYRCLHPEPPPAGLVPSCAEGGVLGVLPGIIGTIQATETVKLILGIGEPLIGRFLVYDALKMRFRELKLPKDPDCPVCGTASDDPRAARVRRWRPLCARGDREDRHDIGSDSPVRQDDRHYRHRAEGADRSRRSAPVILDVREPPRSRSAAFPAPCSSRSSSCRRVSASSTPRRRSSLHCKVGGRSASATAYLQREGFSPRAQSDRRHPGLDRRD